MKTKLLYLIGIFFFFYSFSSCTDDEVLSMPKFEEIREDGIFPLSADSLEIKYLMQSNSEMILADRLIHKDNSYVLDLSWEEASQLGISEDLYHEFSRNVDKLNSSSENY